MNDRSPQNAYSTSTLLNVNVSTDTIVSELKQFAIALKILRKYPDAFNEFKQIITTPEGGPSTYSNRLTEGIANAKIS